MATVYLPQSAGARSQPGRGRRKLVGVIMVMFVAICMIVLMATGSLIIMMIMILRIRQTLHAETMHIDIFRTEVAGCGKTDETCQQKQQ